MENDPYYWGSLEGHVTGNNMKPLTAKQRAKMLANQAARDEEERIRREIYATKRKRVAVKAPARKVAHHNSWWLQQQNKHHEDEHLRTEEVRVYTQMMEEEIAGHYSKYGYHHDLHYSNLN